MYSSLVSSVTATRLRRINSCIIESFNDRGDTTINSLIIPSKLPSIRKFFRDWNIQNNIFTKFTHLAYCITKRKGLETVVKQKRPPGRGRFCKGGNNEQKE